MDAVAANRLLPGSPLVGENRFDLPVHWTDLLLTANPRHIGKLSLSNARRTDQPDCATIRKPHHPLNRRSDLRGTNMSIRRLPLALWVAIAFAATAALSQTPQPSTAASQGVRAPSTSQANAGDALLPSGTAIPAELSKSVDAKKVKAGDKIEAKVTMDLLSHGQIVVPRDSRIMGHVTEAKPRSKESPESRVGVAFDRISLKNGRELSLRTTVQAIGPSMKQAPFPENGNEVPGQAPPDMHAGTTPTWRGTSGAPGASSRPNGSASPRGIPEDMPAGTPPSENSTGMALDPKSQGVIGMKGLSLSSSEQGSVLRSNTSNIHLDGGTQLVLRTE